MASYLEDKTDFLKCLKLCHDCTTLELVVEGGRKKEVLTGASLDEQCLLKAVKQLRVAQFKQRTAKTISIEVTGEAIDYVVICHNEFTSERKLMSVVVREKLTGQLYVYAKGAESKIMERLCIESQASPLKSKIETEVVTFGSQVLRTLVFAMRKMDEEEF